MVMYKGMYVVFYIIFPFKKVKQFFFFSPFLEVSLSLSLRIPVRYLLERVTKKTDVRFSFSPLTRILVERRRNSIVRTKTNKLAN